jgi:hypothetical protein
VKIKYNGGSVLKTEGMKYLRHVCQIAPLHMASNDTLEVTWDITMTSYTNGEITHEEPFRCKTTIKGVSMVVRYIELIWRTEGGTLYVHEEGWQLP